MAATRKASTHWEGSLLEGSGTTTPGSSGMPAFEVTWASRTEAPGGRTSPEELLAEAHSACFSMALSHALAQGGHPPQALDTSAEVDFVPGTGITEIRLSVRGTVPGLTGEEFVKAAEGAKENCPVSGALKAPITLDAALA